MLITKFNRMIRNRLLWGIFAGVISVSFVGLFTSGGGCEGEQARETIAGTAGDLVVTDRELQVSRFYTTLHLSLMMGRPFAHQSPEMREEFEHMAWRRALALKQAEALDLRATDQEVAAQIEQDPMFAADGVFQPRFYQQFTDGFLRQIGVRRRDYQEFVRDEIVLEKLMRVLAAAVWIAPQEMEQHVRTYTDVFAVQTARFTTNALAAMLTEPDDEDVAAYFEEEADRFALPERIRVDYVVFKAADFRDGIEVAEEDVEAYYTDHLADFRRELPDDADDSGVVPGYLDFEEVADDIRDRLAEQQSLFAAMDAATDFVLELVPSGVDRKAVPFAEAAQGHGLSVYSSDPFSRFDPPEEPADVDPEILIRQAFRLEDHPEEYFSDAIAGTSGAYVLALRERIPAGVPSLEEIESRVRAALTAARLRARMQERFGEIRREIIAAMRADPGLTFAAAAAAVDATLAIASHAPFSLYNAPDDLDTADTLYAITARNPGEFTDILTAEDGSLLLVYMMDRHDADEMARGMLRRQIVGNLYRHRAQTTFAEWQDGLLRRLEKARPETAAGETDDGPDMGSRPVL